MDTNVIFFLIIGCLSGSCLSEKYEVNLSHNGPVVLGATITFRAELLNFYGEPLLSSRYQFRWKDDAIPRHWMEEDVTDAVSYWNVSYPANEGYILGQYEAQVEVFLDKIFFFPVASKRITFNITALLNGGMDIIQKGSPRKDLYVSSAEVAEFYIDLNGPDYQYLQNATQVLTYWFVDCVYYGQSLNYTFSYNFTKEEKEHNVEALVVASFESPSTTAAPDANTTVSSTDGSSIITQAASEVQSNEVQLVTATTVSSKKIPDEIPTLCLNSTIVPPDPNKTYGYFRRRLKTKAPLTNITVTGSNWLKHGDMLILYVTCGGSPQYKYCLKTVTGSYNVTGNETCGSETITNDCEFPVLHYFRQPETYTIIIILENDVSKKVTGVAINIYEVTKKPQLSVIVVPVSCSIVAVILIVFGVAYYIQSRNRFTVEVADFDFGQANDMEYRTFHERLREAVQHAFNRTSDSLDEECVWPRSDSHNRTYGSMQ